LGSVSDAEEVTTDATKTVDSDVNHDSVLATQGAHEKAQLFGGSSNCHKRWGLPVEPYQ